MPIRKKVTRKKAPEDASTPKVKTPVVPAPPGWDTKPSKAMVVEILTDRVRTIYGMYKGYIGMASNPDIQYAKSSVAAFFKELGPVADVLNKWQDMPDADEVAEGEEDVKRMIEVAETMDYPEGLYDEES